jgi:D-alanyl-D-alanine carboxypeptidase
MKYKYVLLASLGTLFMLSCTKEIEDSVPACTFDEVAINTSNPLAPIYQELLDEYTASGLPGVSVAIETPSDGWWLGTAGMARIEDETPMEPCHLQHSASIVKPYIATLIMRLSEQDKLDLDDPISGYLPEDMVANIANAELATIRQLLNHSSGIYNFNSNLKIYVDTFNDPLVHTTTETIFEKYVYGIDASHPVGEEFDYSNTGYSLLGMIVESASEMSLGDYFDQEIVEVAGLQNTYYTSSPAYPDIPNTVNSYFEHYPGLLQNCTDIQKDFSNAAMGHEGLIASTFDFARFIQELMRGTILDSSTVAIMIADENRIDDSKTYGLGLQNYLTDYGDAYGHTGGSIGAVGYMMYFPDSDITFSMNSNLSGVFAGANSERFYTDLKDEFLKVLFTGSR